METAAENDNRAAAAAKWNADLARQVNRWMRTRLTFAAMLLLTGIALVASGTYALVAVPCFLAAGIAFLLYLAARDHWREIKSRQWQSVTPFVSRLRANTQEKSSPISDPDDKSR